MVQLVKNPPAMQETKVQSLGWDDLPEKGMATHYSILAWRTPWTEEPGSYSPWGHKELDMTEKLICSLYFSPHRSSDLSLTQERTTVFDQDNSLHIKNCSK